MCVGGGNGGGGRRCGGCKRGHLVLVRGGKHGLQLRHLLHLGRLAGGDGGGGGGRRGSGRGDGDGGGDGSGGGGVSL